MIANVVNRMKKVLGVQTGDYVSTMNNRWDKPRDLPVFDFNVIREMQHDPTVRLGLAMRSAPLSQAEFAYQDADGEWLPGIKASSDRVGEFVMQNLERIWRHQLHKILSAQIWGWASGEVTYRLVDNHVHIDKILARDAQDCFALINNGQIVGTRIKSQKTLVDLKFPKTFWHSFRSQSESPYGMSALRGCYSPWADKALSGGALDVRRLFMHKDAYGGVDMTYPEGTTDIGQDDPVPNQDIARQIAEQISAGGVTTRPAMFDPVTGKNMWELTRASIPSNPVHILNFPKDLDIEILRGLEIPDDVLISENGGAWQGKQVPMQAFFTCADQWLQEVVAMVQVQVMEPLVELNFGDGESFEIQTKPLALQAMEQMAQQPSAPNQGSDAEAARFSLEESVGQGMIKASQVVQASKKLLEETVAA